MALEWCCVAFVSFSCSCSDQHTRVILGIEFCLCLERLAAALLERLARRGLVALAVRELQAKNGSDGSFRASQSSARVCVMHCACARPVRSSGDLCALFACLAVRLLLRRVVRRRDHVDHAAEDCTHNARTQRASKQACTRSRNDEWMHCRCTYTALGLDRCARGVCGSLLSVCLLSARTVCILLDLRCEFRARHGCSVLRDGGRGRRTSVGSGRRGQRTATRRGSSSGCAVRWKRSTSAAEAKKGDRTIVTAE